MEDCFSDIWIKVGPKHELWKKRVKLEIEKILSYQKSQKNSRIKPWVLIFPEKNPTFNYMIWTGVLQIPCYPKLKFEFKILITSNYPKVSPRCFIEEKIKYFCDKLYLKNIWHQNNKKYIMISHDHMHNLNLWNQNYGIYHFLTRVVWLWWAAQQNIIIKENEKKLGTITLEKVDSKLKELLIEFSDKWTKVGPDHSQWNERMVFEIDKINNYFKLLKEYHINSWIFFHPEKIEKFKYKLWNGYLQDPNHTQVKFEIYILLTNNYPKIAPRCYIEEKIINYCSYVSPKMTFEKDGKIFIQMDAYFSKFNWRPTFGLIHFIVKAVQIWWAVNKNKIVEVYNK